MLTNKDFDRSESLLKSYWFFSTAMKTGACAPNPAGSQKMEKKMKKILFVLFSLSTTLALAQAVPNIPPGSTLLSVQQTVIGDLVVALPTVRNTDGSVCVGYIADTSRNTAGQLLVTTSKVCGKSATDAVGNTTGWPDQLAALKNEQNGDLIKQVPVIK